MNSVRNTCLIIYISLGFPAWYSFVRRFVSNLQLYPGHLTRWNWVVPMCYYHVYVPAIQHNILYLLFTLRAPPTSSTMWATLSLYAACCWSSRDACRCHCKVGYGISRCEWVVMRIELLMSSITNSKWDLTSTTGIGSFHLVSSLCSLFPLSFTITKSPTIALSWNALVCGLWFFCAWVRTCWFLLDAFLWTAYKNSCNLVRSTIPAEQVWSSVWNEWLVIIGIKRATSEREEKSCEYFKRTSNVPVFTFFQPFQRWLIYAVLNCFYYARPLQCWQLSFRQRYSRWSQDLFAKAFYCTIRQKAIYGCEIMSNSHFQVRFSNNLSKNVNLDPLQTIACFLDKLFKWQLCWWRRHCLHWWKGRSTSMNSNYLSWGGLRCNLIGSTVPYTNRLYERLHEAFIRAELLPVEAVSCLCS